MADPKPNEQEEHPLPPGTPAPDFTLKSTPDQKYSLHDFHGRPIVLAFYPADWSPTCTGEMGLINEVLPEFNKFNAQVLGISVDGPHSHRAFMEAKNLKFPILSDFEPKGEVGRMYGIYRGSEGRNGRALFVIDADGIIRWSYVSPVPVNPGVDGILNALEELNPGEKEHAGSDRPG